jgi:hypothetical protein
MKKPVVRPIEHKCPEGNGTGFAVVDQPGRPGAKDYVTRGLFEQLMHDEEHHIDFLETQIDLVAKLGLELYAQHHIGELES